MTTLHPMLRHLPVADAAPSVPVVEVHAAPVPPSPAELATMLDAAAAHLDDAIEMLGRRSSGMSLGAAARHVDAALFHVTALVRIARNEEHPLPEQLRIAMSRLRTADLELAELSRSALSIVPPASAQLDAQAIQLRGWADSARAVAAWIAAGAGTA